MSTTIPPPASGTAGAAGLTAATTAAASLPTAQAAGQALFSQSSSPSFDFSAAYQTLQQQVGGLSPGAQNDYLWSAVNTFLQLQGQAWGRQLAQAPSGQSFQASAGSLADSLTQSGLFSAAQVQTYAAAIQSGFTQAGGNLGAGAGVTYGGQSSQGSASLGAGGGISLPMDNEPVPTTSGGAAAGATLGTGMPSGYLSTGAGTTGIPGTTGTTGATGTAGATVGTGATVGAGTSNASVAAVIGNAPPGVVGLVSGSDLGTASLTTWNAALVYYHSATPAQQQALIAGLNASQPGAGDGLKAAADKVSAGTLTVAQAAAQSLPGLGGAGPGLPSAAQTMLQQAGTAGAAGASMSGVSDADYRATLSWLQGQSPAVQLRFTSALSSASLGSNSATDYGRKLSADLGLGGTTSGAASPIDPTTISEPAAKSLLTDATGAATASSAGSGAGVDFASWQKVTSWLASQPAGTRASFSAAIGAKFGPSSALAQQVAAAATAAAASPAPPAGQLAAATFPGWQAGGGTGGASAAGSSGSTASSSSGATLPANVAALLAGVAGGAANISSGQWQSVVAWYAGLPTGTPAQQALKSNVKAALNAEYPQKDPAHSPPMGAGDALQYASDGYAAAKTSGAQSGIAQNYLQELQKAAS